MNWKYVVILLFLFITIITGCSKAEPTNFLKVETFPTKEEAINNFLNENPRSDVEYIETTEGDEIYIVRSGNHQYSVYEMKFENEGYSVLKLTASLSLQNTIAGSGEFSTTKGNDYRFLVVKKGKIDELDYGTRSKYSAVSIYSEDAELALNKGHIIENDGSMLPENAIHSIKTIAEPNVSS